MSTPTVASRLRRRVILLSSDSVLLAHLQAALPQGWEMRAATTLEAIGGFEEILQHRFVLLDLDDAAFDPIEAVTELRTGLALNIVVVTLGGDRALRDAARLARADRFFDRAQAIEVMRQFCDQYGW